MLNQILIAKKDFVDINLKTLVAAGETVKCVYFDEPNIGTIYTVRLQHFGKDETTELKLDVGGLHYLEPANKEILDVLSWYFALYNDVRATAPEYFERCYDLNAVQYLNGEAWSIYNRLQQAETDAAVTALGY